MLAAALTVAVNDTWSIRQQADNDYLQATQLLAQGNLREARTLLEAHLQEHPTAGGAWWMLGCLNLAEGQFDDAVAALNQSLTNGHPLGPTQCGAEPPAEEMAKVLLPGVRTLYIPLGDPGDASLNDEREAILRLTVPGASPNATRAGLAAGLCVALDSGRSAVAADLILLGYPALDATIGEVADDAEACATPTDSWFTRHTGGALSFGDAWDQVSRERLLDAVG